MIPPRRKSPAEIRLDALFAELEARSVPRPGDVAAALVRNVADGITVLPTPAAEAGWRRVKRILRLGTAGNAVPGDAMAAVRSWPQARVGELLEALRAVHADLMSESNARWEAEIREELAKTYL